MKKIQIISAVVVLFTAIAIVLFYNRSQIQAKSVNETKDFYYVTVVDAVKKILDEKISQSGTIFSENEVNILSETNGRVTNVYAEVGDYVKAGTVLLQVDDEMKKAQYNIALASFEKLKKDFERSQSLFSANSISDAQFEAAKLAYINAEAQFTIAKRQLNDTKITSPINGVINARYVNTGSYLQGAPAPSLVATVVDVSNLKIKLNVSESTVFKLKLRDKVLITTDVYPGVEFWGTIKSIGSKGDEAHSFPIEISLQNNSRQPLKAGMFALVNFTSLSNDEALVIPRQALVGSVKDPAVFVVENGVAKYKKIVTGNQFENYIEVKNGIVENEKIVVSGQNILEDNAKVEIK